MKTNAKTYSLKGSKKSVKHSEKERKVSAQQKQEQLQRDLEDLYTLQEAALFMLGYRLDMISMPRGEDGDEIPQVVFISSENVITSDNWDDVFFDKTTLESKLFDELQCCVKKESEEYFYVLSGERFSKQVGLRKIEDALFSKCAYYQCWLEHKGFGLQNYWFCDYPDWRDERVKKYSKEEKVDVKKLLDLPNQNIDEGKFIAPAITIKQIRDLLNEESSSSYYPRIHAAILTALELGAKGATYAENRDVARKVATEQLRSLGIVNRDRDTVVEEDKNSIVRICQRERNKKGGRPPSKKEALPDFRKAVYEKKKVSDIRIGRRDMNDDD